MKKFLLIFAIIPLFFSCNGPDEPTPGPEPDPGKTDPINPGTTTGLPDIANLKIGDTFTIPFAGELLLPYSGVKAGDSIELQLRSDNSKRYSLKCVRTEDKGAVFTVPSSFIGGMCKLSFRTSSRNDVVDTFVSVCDTMEVERHPGMTTYGRVIDYNGNPIAGVVVSDGVRTTTTDSNGCYWLASMRKRGYVFISIPDGYFPAVKNTIPQFFSRFKSDKSSDYEIHSFVLERVNMDKHRAVIFTDTHLARRTNDISQFENYFKTDITEQINAARTEGLHLFGMALGDLAWDEFWYANNFSLAEYYEIMSSLDMPIFSIPGNHDNDPYIADDFGSEEAFRKNLGPTYYSFNAGGIHYIMMDNTIFNNTGASQGKIGNVQDYTQGFKDDELRWLEADLKAVPAGKTIVFGNHIQFTTRPSKKSDGSFSFSYTMPAEFREELVRLFAPYNVHIVTGHTHVNYTNRIADNIVEHNLAAVCGTWWWTGYYSTNNCRINGDGSPSGYKILNVSSPSDIKMSFKPLARSKDYQFRAYDLNNCRITRSLYCSKASTSKVTNEIFSKYAVGYDAARSDNKVLINVFDWSEDWTISVLENGNELIVNRVDTYDPLHVVHFNMARLNTNSTSVTFPTNVSSHMFEVTCSSATSSLNINVKDGYGNSYSETMHRPRNLYDMSKENKW